MKKINYLLLAIITLLFSCQSDDNSGGANTAPSEFTITVSEIQSTQAKLNWTEAIDSDKDKVSYTIELNENIVVEGLTDLSYTLQNLTNNVKYNVKIIAKDTKGAETASSQSFETTDLPGPQDFTISISEIDYTSATINWTKSITSENNAISYTISIDNKIIKENITNLSCKIISLKHNTNFTGQITAIADNGQILIKDFEFKTLENKAPEKFELVYAVSNGPNTASFRFNKAIDPEDDTVEYRVILNDKDITDSLFDSSISAPTPTINHSIKNLAANTSYEIKIKAIDSFGNESFSNPINFVTNKTIPDNFDIKVEYVQGKIILRWDKLSDSTYTTGTSNGTPKGSVYVLDGVSYDLGKAYIVDYQTETTATFNTTLISPDKEHTLQIVLNWEFSNNKSYSNVFDVFNKTYTNTIVWVDSANIFSSTAEYFPLQFTIKFRDALISELEDYEITEIKIHDKVITNYIVIEQGAVNKGYVTGNITKEDFDYLKEFTDGYIETRDEKGSHKISFNYVAKN